MPADTRQLKSYVWHKEQCFFISTIERDSSASANPGRYFETLAWEFDWETKLRGQQIAGCGDGDACKQHMNVTEQLYRTGVFVD